MSPTEFQDLQEAFLVVFLPIIHWLLALFVVGGFAVAIFIIWHGLFAWMGYGGGKEG